MIPDLLDDDLHLFFDDAEVLAREGIGRRVNTLSRESEPVLVGDRPWESAWQGGWISVVHDEQADHYKMLYVAHPAGSRFHGVCVAISSDGVEWEKPELDVYALPDGTRTNVVLPWEHGSTQTLLTLLDRVPGPRYQAMTYQVHRDPDGTPTGRGMYRGVSDDGLDWKLDVEPTLPAQGDRMQLAWDPRRQTCMLLTRHRYLSVQRQAGVQGLKRDMDLWESPDLLAWTHRGRMLWPDDDDPADTEFYSMFPAAYGPGYLGFIEVYHTAEETLDVQLAWSDDARRWRRVAGRKPVMPLGGEGAWDSHWIMLASTPPEPVGDRLRFWYAGACTHHGAADLHRRAFGIATIRRDGFVSMEGEMFGGSMVCGPLDAREPRRLTLNLRAETGAASVEVLSATGEGVEGFSAADCRFSSVNAVDVEVHWRGGSVVPPQPDGEVLLRFNLQSSSLYSYRWLPA